MSSRYPTLLAEIGDKFNAKNPDPSLRQSPFVHLLNALKKYESSAQQQSMIDKYIEDYKKKDSNVTAREKSATEIIKDYRITHLLLSGYRKYPISDFYYGIEFVDSYNCTDNKILRDFKNYVLRIKEEPSSLFLYGRNATGKTSLFSGLESEYGEEAGEILYRGLASDNSKRTIIKREYCRHHKADPDPMSGNTQKAGKDYMVKVLHSEKTEPDFNKTTPLTPFFISEYYMHRMMQLMPMIPGENTRWNNLFLEMMGEGWLIDLSKLLFDLAKKIDMQSTEIECQPITFDDLSNVTKDCVEAFYGSFINTLSLKDANFEGNLNDSISLCKTISALDKLPKSKDDYKDLLSKLQSLNKALWIIDTITPNSFQSILDLLYKKIGEFCSKRSGKRNSGLQIRARENELRTILNNYYQAAEYFKSSWLSKVTNDGSKSNMHESIVAILKKHQQDVYEKSEDSNKLIKIKDNIEDLSNIIDEIKLREVISFADNEFINKMEELLNGHLSMSKGDNFQITVNEKGIDILIKRKDGSVTTPTVYLNSFHLNYLVLALRMMIAIRIMKKEGFLFPIVIDDVFSASDFDNKKIVSEFFSQIYDFFNKYVNDKRKRQLQIILFTHDEQLLKLCYDGLKDRYSVKFGHLYDYRDYQPNQTFKKVYIDDECYSFLNLYEKLFSL